MNKSLCKFVGFALLAVMPWYSVTVAQDWAEPEAAGSSSSGSSEDPFGGDPFEGNMPDGGQLPPLETPPTAQPPSSPVAQPPASPALSPSMSSDGPVQNAIIEGVQLSSEPGDQPDEKIISCYFIFRDKPSSYFYEIKTREKKLIFEFNDTKTGASPVPSVSEAPIRGFTIEQRKFDMNKDVRGLKPEWHDLIRVTFDLEAVPDVRVNDEYSIISFSYKWTTNPDKMDQYVIKDKSMAPIWWSTAGLGGIGLGILAYFLTKEPEPPPPLGALPYDDLPKHEK